jgi:hypothetical protein
VLHFAANPAAKNQTHAASAAVDSIDQAIELEVKTRMLDEKAKSSWRIDRDNFHLLHAIVAERDPFFAQPCAGPDRAWRQYFDAFDQIHDPRPVGHVSNDCERSV